MHSLLRKLESENEKVKQSKQEIVRLQNHDPLTGLPNRISAEEIFNQQAKLGVRQNFKTALLFLELDNFKSINDKLGHTAGDQILKSLFTRLKQQIRSTDTLYSFGGDEFVSVAHYDSNLINEPVLAEKYLHPFKSRFK